MLLVWHREQIPCQLNKQSPFDSIVFFGTVVGLQQADAAHNNYWLCSNNKTDTDGRLLTVVHSYWAVRVVFDKRWLSDMAHKGIPRHAAKC